MRITHARATGFVVDPHVKGLAYRIGQTDEKRPEKVEQDLMAMFPQNEWIYLGHALISHGRQDCDAHSPQCGICPVEHVFWHGGFMMYTGYGTAILKGRSQQDLRRSGRAAAEFRSRR